MSAFPTAPSQDDGRLELSMAAARAERRNRPRLMLILASLILLIAIISVFWSFTARTAAHASLSRANSTIANIRGVVDQLEILEDKRLDPKYNPDSGMETKLQQFAVQVGLARPEVSAKDPNISAAIKGFRKRVYSTVINESDPDLLMRWVAEATNGTSFPGLEVESLKLTPGRTLESGKIAWNLDVSFRRWERQP